MPVPWIPVGWSILAVAGVACVAGGLRRLERQARRWPPARVGEEPVLVSPDFGPAVLGVRRSVVVLPSWALSLPAAERRAIEAGFAAADIVIERENVRFYFPIVTSLLVSAVLTAVLWLLNR